MKQKLLATGVQLALTPRKILTTTYSVFQLIISSKINFSHVKGVTVTAAPKFSDYKGSTGTKIVIEVLKNIFTAYTVHTLLLCGITLLLL